MTILFAGCSNEASSPLQRPPDASATQRGTDSSETEEAALLQIVDIVITGDSAEASGETVEVNAGEKFALHITAGAALRGEVHVRSTPEQVFKYEGGASAFVLSIDQPGLVDVAVDDLNKVIVQVKVS